MQFWKGHALGNDYIILDGTGEPAPGRDRVRALCDRHRGVGSDGVLVADLDGDPVGLRIFNPDGSEAEKSGNGLRIFGAWLHGQGHVGEEPFRVALATDTVEMAVEARSDDGVLRLRVDMGPASFRAGDIPDAETDPEGEVQGAPLRLDDETVAIHLVSFGNPHCVVFVDELDMDVFRRRGPAIETHPRFQHGVNVQLARATEPGVLEARIWERGAGETLASGSSACAVAAAARRAGIVSGERFEVRMLGGAVRVEIDDDWQVRLTGEARVVFRGWLEDGVV